MSCTRLLLMSSRSSWGIGMRSSVSTFVFQFFFTEFLKSTDAAWRTEASTRTSLLATIWRTCSAWPGICWSATSWLSARIIMYYTVIELYKSEYGRLRLVLKLPRTVLQTRHSLELTKTPSLCMWKQSLRNFGTDLIERRLRNWCFVFVIIYPKKKELALTISSRLLLSLFSFYCVLLHIVYWLILCLAWYCVLLLILCTDWYECCWFFLPGRLLHFLYTVLCIIGCSAWCWLTLPAPKLLLVIVLSVLCGWVPLYWRTYLLISDTECMRRPNRLMHAWVCGIAVADWYMRNRSTCSHGPVRSLLSGSDGLWSEESDHINVLAGQAVSKPH